MVGINGWPGLCSSEGAYVNNNDLTYELFIPSTATNKRYFGHHITILKNIPYEIFFYIVDNEDDR